MFIPLRREPEILFGLTLSDLAWLASAAVTDLALGLHGMGGIGLRLGLMVVIAAVGAAMAIVQIKGASLPRWMGRIILFWLRPRLYLP